MTLAALFGTGASRASVTDDSWRVSGIEMLGLGVVVAAVVYGSGLVVAAMVGG